MSAEYEALYRHPATLEQIIRGIEPACRIVPERHLRRVVRALAQNGETWNFNPALPVWIDREQLAGFDIVRESVLEGEPDTRLLMVTPDDRFGQGSIPDDALLQDYWRTLLRGRLLRRIDEKRRDGNLPDEILVLRILSWGEPAAREIRYVLESDDLIPDQADWPEVYRVFVAVYGERSLFAPDSLQYFFPSLPPVADVLAVLTQDVDLNLELENTRLPGAAPPDTMSYYQDEVTHDEMGLPIEFVLEDDGEPTRLRRLARRAARSGNYVRAAILRMRVARRSPDAEHQKAVAAAISTLRDGLVSRLQLVLKWDYSTTKDWTLALTPLLAPATMGLWPRAARVLYDLQKIVVDLEREISTVEPIEWLRSLGRLPLRRPLTRARSVILLHHLMTASNHLRRVHIPASDRGPLERLLKSEIHAAERVVRNELGPVIRKCLDDVGFHPTKLLETIAWEKLIAELLDRICERGFLRLSDLRDAIARNQCKVPDLQGPREFITGDLLLRADERLAEELHGVYRRGEIYLRWIQRLTAVSFGTSFGRWLTRYLAIPFGGAFLTVEFAKYLVHEANTIWTALRTSVPQRTPIEVGQAIPAQGIELPQLQLPTHEGPLHAAEHAIHLTPTTIGIILGLGFFIMGLMQSLSFRTFVRLRVSECWAVLTYCLLDIPLDLWHSRWLVNIRRSRIIRFVNRYLGPGIVAGLGTYIGLTLLDAEPRVAWSWAWFTFAIVVLFVNSPSGRAVSDWFEETVSDTWRQIRANLIPGILSWIQLLFRELAGLVERILYAVDERLRFRHGRVGESLIAKTILASIWFPIAYSVRFAFTLLLEPQINPVKHFPVVTVSHKLLLPLIPSASTATGLSAGTVTLIIGGIPGIFGFIVWELKENWRLYAANRTPHQPPVILGHHGETMRGLLRLGFHSGTIPRLFRRMRAAIEATEASRRPVPTTRLLHDFHELEASIIAMVERELIALLRAARCWESLIPGVRDTRLGVQQVLIRIAVHGSVDAEFQIGFEQFHGGIESRIVDHYGLSELNDEQREAFAVALSGLCEKAGATWASGTPAWANTIGPTLWDDRVAYWEAARVDNTCGVSPD